jgi:hypothetical protein
VASPPQHAICPGVQSLARSRCTEDDYFLVAKPGTGPLSPIGPLETRSVVRRALLTAPALFVPLTPLLLNVIDGVAAPVLAAGLSGWGGLTISVAVGRRLRRGGRHRSPHRRDQQVCRVTPTNRLAWHVCTSLMRLGSTQSWNRREVDPARRSIELSWAAVVRALRLDVEEIHLARAGRYGSLTEVTREMSERYAREWSALDAVADNLNAVRQWAEHIDHERARAEGRVREYRRRQLDEQRLWALLLGDSGVARTRRTEDLADVTAGLAAEATAVATLLQESDRLLNGGQ